jgi:hypothetical protein
MSSLAEFLRPSLGSAPAVLDVPAPRESRPGDALRLIGEAEALGIPWKEILSREIQAESTLQRFLGTDMRDLPLWRVISILPNSLLHCWRARDLLDRVFWEASAEGSRAARREVTALVDCLTGRRSRRVRESMILARHYWFAYNRVLELQALALAAEKCAAPPESRAVALHESTGAPRRDIAWAIARITSPDRSYVLDDAMARAREEGFEIPRASTEPEAFLRLRRFVTRHDFRPRRSRRVRRPTAPDETPEDELVPEPEARSGNGVRRGRGGRT